MRNRSGRLKNASKTCQVAVCNSPSGISYHTFPKDPYLCHEWVKACRRGDPIKMKGACICSRHFCETDFERDLMNELLNLPQRSLLKPDAIPTLHLLPETIESKIASKSKKIAVAPTKSTVQSTPVSTSSHSSTSKSGVTTPSIGSPATPSQSTTQKPIVAKTSPKSPAASPPSSSRRPNPGVTIIGFKDVYKSTSPVEVSSSSSQDFVQKRKNFESDIECLTDDPMPRKQPKIWVNPEFAQIIVPKTKSELFQEKLAARVRRKVEELESARARAITENIEISATDMLKARVYELEQKNLQQQKIINSMCYACKQRLL